MGRLENKTTFKLFGRRYFVSVLMGVDQRTHKVELSDERRSVSPSLVKAFLFATALLWTLFSVMALTVVAAYLAKSYMGIDLVAGSSPVPEFLHKIRLCH